MTFTRPPLALASLALTGCSLALDLEAPDADRCDGLECGILQLRDADVDAVVDVVSATGACQALAARLSACVVERCQPAAPVFDGLAAEIARACAQEIATGVLAAADAEALSARPCSDAGLVGRRDALVDGDGALLGRLCRDGAALPESVCGEACARLAECEPESPWADPDDCALRCTIDDDATDALQCYVDEDACARRCLGV